MNKLGFYTQKFQYMFKPVLERKPPVMLAEMNDRGFLREMRNIWSPNTFVVGRYFLEHQRDRLYEVATNPTLSGVRLAERILYDDFNFATQRGRNGRFYVDAWMTFNELLPGPRSSNWLLPHLRAEIIRDAEAYDEFQVAFLRRLKEEDPKMEAVAFNFAAGNWMDGDAFIEYFPNTLAAYTYLGFHEYGWPYMNPEQPGAITSCGSYATIMEPIREKYGDKHKVIITEAGLALMYTYPTHPAGDVGWAWRNKPGYPVVPEVSAEDYRPELQWYNDYMNEDDYVLGACIFMCGSGSPDWDTFEIFGNEEGQPL